jgi:ubiquitin C-terminal hydrolase
MQLVNFQNNYNNTVTLEDCFKYNQTITPLNDYYCNICKKTSNAQFANFISVSPNIIIIILNRGAGLQYKVKIDFEENLDLRNYVEYFKSNFRSIISNLFYGLIYNQTQCQFCKTIIYNYQTFNFLIFPLSEVLNYKMKLVNFQNNYNNTVTLEDCFKYNQNFTVLNDYYCNACRKTSSAMFANFISVLPNIIIIILNRGAGLRYKIKIDFEENLNLKNYVEFFKGDAFYELIGVVTHYGESGASGHFMARCKSPIDGYWYLYNDAIIQKLEYFTKENFLQGNPYILFYKKTKFAN